MPKITKIVENVAGTVLSFSDGKGLITFEQFGDVDVDHSAIVFPVNRNGNNYLRPKQNVVCNLMCGPKGMFADKVKVVFQKKPSQDKDRPPSVTRSFTSTGDGSGVPSMAEMAVIEKDLRGEVTEFDPSRRSGYVVIRQYGKLPCYAQHIVFSGLEAVEACLQPSQIVRCDVGRGKLGVLIATNIHVICDAPSEGGGKDDAKKAAKEAPPIAAAAKSEAPKAKKTLEVIASDQLGEVTSYNPSGGTGHIQVQGFDKLPVKKADVVGAKPLRPQQIVRLDVVRGPKANATSNVRIIADAPKKKNVQATQPSEDAQKDQDIVARDQLGEMVSFNLVHRNGHVKVQGFGNLVVNRTALDDTDTLKPQQVVKCDVSRGPKSNYASNVRLISLIGTEDKGKANQPQNPQEKAKQPQNPQEKAKQPQNPQEKAKQPQNPQEKAKQPQNPQEKAKQPQNPQEIAKQPQNPQENAKEPQNPQENAKEPPSLHNLSNPQFVAPSHPPPPPMNPHFQYPQNQGPTNYYPGFPTNPPYPFPQNPGAVPPNYYPHHPMNPQYPYPSNPNVFPPPQMPPALAEMPPPYQSGAPMPAPQIANTSSETTSEKSSKKAKKKKKVENELANAVEKLKLICEICKDRLEDPVTIPCEHLFCRECLSEWLAMNPTCPVDGKAVSKKAVKPAPLKVRELATVLTELHAK